MSRWADHVRWFSPLGDPRLNDPAGDKLDLHLMEMLDAVRYDVGRPILVTSGYRDPAHNESVSGATNSAHLTGEAVDGYIVDVPLIRAFMYLSQYPFTGIGLYPYTSPPVFHVDVKPRHRASPVPLATTTIWLRCADGTYVTAPSEAFDIAFDRWLGGT